MIRNSISQVVVPMLPMLAQFNGNLPVGTVEKWLWSLAAVAICINQVAGAVQRFRRPPVGMETSEACVLKHEPIIQRLGSLEEADRVVGSKIDALRREIKDDQKGIVRQYEEVIKAVGRIEGKIE